MALKSGTFNGGTTPAKVSTVIALTKQDLFEIEFVADPGNSGNVYLGPSTVTSAGANATLRLAAGASKRYGPYNQGSFQIDLESLYVVGSAAGQLCYINAITAQGRRIPLQR